MTDSCDRRDSDRITVDRAIFLSRLSEELATLESMADDLQGALHMLPLANSSPETRKVLQSADKLTQSLNCLSAAIGGLSRTKVASRDYDMTAVLDGVHLADLRDRLVHGQEKNGHGKIMPGKVDLF